MLNQSDFFRTFEYRTDPSVYGGDAFGYRKSGVAIVRYVDFPLAANISDESTKGNVTVDGNEVCAFNCNAGMYAGTYGLGCAARTDVSVEGCLDIVRNKSTFIPVEIMYSFDYFYVEDVMIFKKNVARCDRIFVVMRIGIYLIIAAILALFGVTFLHLPSRAQLHS